MEQKVLQTILKYNLIEKNDKVVIGVSGGPDSISLLHILNLLKDKLHFELYVAHINHMIREVADEETEYVKEFCKKINVECFVKKIDVIKIAKEAKKGTEEVGRDIRYNFFEEVAKKTHSNKIATAHNKNDSVETTLFNIIRGSGLSGLKGIEAIRNKKFIRPLIEIEREEIELYCKVNNLQPKYDETNFNTIYTRNKIRNLLIPYIKKEFNPNIIKTIGRLSEVVTEENDYLDKITEKVFNEISLGENLNAIIVLDLKKFNSLELVIKRRLIRKAISKVIGTTAGLEKINIDDIIALCSRNIGNKYLEPNKKIKILVKDKKILFIKNN